MSAGQIAEELSVALDSVLRTQTMPGFANVERERAHPVSLPAWFIDRCRQAYLSIALSDHVATSRVIGISSASHGEGKTAIAVGVATAMAIDTGERTLLMECDFASSVGFSDVFRIKRDPGLAEWLEGVAKLRFVPVSPFDNAFMVPAGSPDVDASRLLYQLGETDIIGELRPMFRNIVIDLPPTLNIAYSSLASRLADHVLLVARYGETTLEDLEQAMFLLGRDRIAGILLNQYNPKTPRWLRRLL